MLHMRAARSMIVTLIAILLSFPIVNLTLKDAEAYTPHTPIMIIGDTNFTPSNGVVSGSGTISDPYVISGWEIDTKLVDGITIKDTTAYFVIRDIYAYTSSTTQYSSTGIRLHNVTNGHVENVNTSIILGIIVVSSNNITITSNNINSSYGWGIFIGNSNNITLTGNNILSSFDEGLFLIESTNITVSSNSFLSDGVVVWGYSIQHYASHTITPDNMINGYPLIYHKNCNNIVVDSNPVGQLIVANCTNVLIANLTISDSDVGVALAYVDGALVHYNNISDQNQGIIVDTSMNTTITANAITTCREYCIHFELSSNGRVTYNEVKGKGWNGVYLERSSSITLMANNISKISEGVEMRYSENITVIDNNISMNNKGIVADYQNSNLLISSNNINGTIDQGIFLSQSGNVSVVANNISGGDMGIYISRAFTNISIANNNISYTDSGIYISNVANITIIDNNISNCKQGIMIQRSIARIENNSFRQNIYLAIHVSNSNDTKIINNYFSDNGQGVRLSWSTNTTITGNTFVSNGVLITALSTTATPFHFDTHTITPDNLVNGKPILYFKRCSNLDLNGTVAGQIIIANCKDVRITNSQINNTDAAIEIVYSSDILVDQNTLIGNLYGIYQESSTNITISGNVLSSSPKGSGVCAFFLKEFRVIGNIISDIQIGLFLDYISNATVASNNIVSNSGHGILLLDSENIMIITNNISHNNIGIHIAGFGGSKDISVYHNNFVNNSIPAVDDSGNDNFWDNGYPSGGNYWSNYTGEDWCTGSNQDICPSPDGIGDTPFMIDINSMDKYPLMWPFGITDIVPPTVSIISPETNENVTTTPIEILGNASDAGGSGLSRVEVRVNGGIWTIATGKTLWNATIELTIGLNTIEARSWDYAGNPSVITNVTVIFRPSVRIVSPTNGTVVENPFLTVTGTSNHTDLVQVRLEGGDWSNVIFQGTSNWGIILSLSMYVDGEIVIEARALNDSIESEYDSIIIMLSLSPITLTIISPGENAIISGIVEVFGAASNGSKVHIRIDGINWTTVAFVPNQWWSFSLDTTQLSNGMHVIEARAVLGVHESAIVARNVTVNNAGHEDKSEPIFVLVIFILLIIIILILLLWRRKKRHTDVDEKVKEAEQEHLAQPPSIE